MDLDTYYNKFNEDKRLETRRGQVEYTVSLKYIHDYLNNNSKILDIGAGTGKYSLKLFDEGYDVTAIELIKHNLGIIKAKNKDIKAYQGNALDLSRFSDNTFDVVLLFGPMYHLKTFEEQVRSLKEAIRVTKNGGIILVSYCMNEYALITHGFKDNNIIKCINNNEIDKQYHITSTGNELYNYVRLEDIDKINKECNINRLKIVASDGPASYIKEYLNKMDEETFKTFIDYQLSVSERMDLIGSSTHVIDILKKC